MQLIMRGGGVFTHTANPTVIERALGCRRAIVSIGEDFPWRTIPFGARRTDPWPWRQGQ